MAFERTEGSLVLERPLRPLGLQQLAVLFAMSISAHPWQRARAEICSKLHELFWATEMFRALFSSDLLADTLFRLSVDAAVCHYSVRISLALFFMSLTCVPSFAGFPLGSFYTTCVLSCISIFLKGREAANRGLHGSWLSVGV